VSTKACGLRQVKFHLAIYLALLTRFSAPLRLGGQHRRRRVAKVTVVVGTKRVTHLRTNPYPYPGFFEHKWVNSCERQGHRPMRASNPVPIDDQRRRSLGAW
jgi:hypothetical protein